MRVMENPVLTAKRNSSHHTIYGAANEIWWEVGHPKHLARAFSALVHNLHDMRFPTMWYVQPANPQISLRIPAVWSEPLLVAWILYVCKGVEGTTLGVSKLKMGLHRLIWVHLSKCRIVGNHVTAQMLYDCQQSPSLIGWNYIQHSRTGPRIAPSVVSLTADPGSRVWSWPGPILSWK